MRYVPRPSRFIFRTEPRYVFVGQSQDINRGKLVIVRNSAICENSHPCSRWQCAIEPLPNVRKTTDQLLPYSESRQQVWMKKRCPEENYRRDQVSSERHPPLIGTVRAS